MRFKLSLRPFLAVSLVISGVSVAIADTLVLPDSGDRVIGQVRFVRSTYLDTFSDIALGENQGFNELRLANPDVDAWLPGDGTQVVIPSRHVLPDVAQEGIVINVPEMRLFFFPKVAADEAPVVITHPISIGRREWTTPHGGTKIVAKAKEPAWYPPESIRAEHEERGDPLPKIVPPGPENPLGKFALRLGLPGYLIHGTNKPAGLGMRVTHGCIRMYPSDIEQLFHQTKVGTAVRIINQPFKVGILNDALYLEAHPPLDEDVDNFRNRYTHIVNLIVTALDGRKANIDWNDLQRVLARSSGIPERIGDVLAAEPPAATANLSGSAASS